MNNHQIISVENGQKGVRIDVWLTRQLAGISRSRIQQLIRAGFVTVNTPVKHPAANRGTSLRNPAKPKMPFPHIESTRSVTHSIADGSQTFWRRRVKESHKIKPGERIEVNIPPPRPVELKAEKIPLNILFEDEALIVIDKPAGMVVHPAPGHNSGTLVNAILHHCPNLSGIGGELRPGIVHRLDKDTSGVILVAKTGAALSALADQFKRREISKEYLAIVWGVLSPPTGEIKTLIGRHATDRKKMTAMPKKGRLSITHYETISTFEKFSLVRLCPETGRTHQIRVHLAHLHHPVAGDAIYGRRSSCDLPVEVSRQMLHAHKISFRHPVTGKKMEFVASLPEDMLHLLNCLRSVKQQKMQNAECRM